MHKGLRSLPSLDFLKGFDAAARSLSFTQAAAELFLTQSALSRQIKALEEQIGHALFVRGHRELRLTEAGASLQPVVRAVLGDLARTVASIRARHGGRRVSTDRLQPKRRGRNNRLYRDRNVAGWNDLFGRNAGGKSPADRDVPDRC